MSEITAYEKGSNYVELKDIVSAYPEFDATFKNEIQSWVYPHKELLLKMDLGRFLPTIFPDNEKTLVPTENK